MILDCSSYGYPQAPLLAFRIFIPLRQIHECTTLRDVAVNLAGNRRDMRVPWPDRILGMTILTGAFEYRADGLRDV